jgi:hypothetical protein
VDAVALTDPDTLMVSGGGVGLVKQSSMPPGTAIGSGRREVCGSEPVLAPWGRKTKLPALLVLRSCPCVWLLFT